MDMLEAAFHPRAIAVVGASDNPWSFGYHFLRHLLDYGYAGRIYAVNPAKDSVLGLRTYADLSSVPGSVDYVISCLPASKVLQLLGECPGKAVKVVHLLAARFGETGRQEGKDLEKRVLQEARRLNIRLIGPNCMGIYCPGSGIAHGYDMPQEAGTVGGVFQSGGLSDMLVHYGQLQGLRFSKVISYGNALDLDESDLLRYLGHDDETKLIAAYFEGVKDGLKFLSALAEAAHAKPVIVIKGGRGTAGTKAAASHTAAIAGSNSMWEAALRKAGAIQARDVGELVDFLAAFSYLPPITGERVAVTGGGGGMSVTAADACEEAGLTVPPLPLAMRESLEIGLPGTGDLLGNPVDGSIMGGMSIAFEAGVSDIPSMLAGSPDFDFIIAQIAEEAPFSEENWSTIVRMQAEQIIDLKKEKLKPVVAVVTGGKFTSDHFSDWRWKLLAEQRARLVAAGIATYSTVSEAAKAVRRVIDYWQARMPGKV